MRSKRLALAAVAAASLAAVPIAAAGMMHPDARRAAVGHGRARRRQPPVELDEGPALLDVRRCTTMHVTGASIRDAHGMMVAKLGPMYKREGLRAWCR